MALRCAALAAALALAGAHEGEALVDFLARFINLPQTTDGPEQLWVNYGRTPDQLVFTWLTADLTAGSSVQYGFQPGQNNFQAQGNSSTYTYGNYTSGLIHRVTVSGLPFNTTIYYMVGSSAASGYSAEYSVTTSPGVGPSLFPFNFALIGDAGQTNNTNDTFAHVLANPSLNAVLMPGDLSYADGFQPRWDSFQRLIQPLTTGLPTLVAAGNHELEVGGSLNLFEAYQARFGGMPWDPSTVPASDAALYYSVDVGPAHIIALSSFSAYNQGSAQYNWLQADLAAFNRTRTPWMILVAHAPWYCSNAVHTNDGLLMRLTLEPMLYAAGLDIAFWGHVHAYERTVPVNGGNPDPKGAVHITLGDAGNREGLYAHWNDPQPVWSAFRQAEYGHGELQLVNTTHAVFTWHRNPDAEPVIADTAWIVNAHVSATATSA